MGQLYEETIVDAVTGEVTIRQFTAEEIAECQAEWPIAIRERRDFLLQKEVDPIVSNTLRWANFTDAQRAAWAQYRTDLLNVPQQSGFPTSVTWPTKPE